MGIAALGAPAVGATAGPGTECPSLEGEPCDDSGGLDTVNGGCTFDPVIFGEAACGQTMCGQTWALDGVRDVDTFHMVTPEASTVSLTLTPEFPAVIWGTNTGTGMDCGAVYVLWITEVPAGEMGVLELPGSTSPEDVVWWFIGSSVFDGVPCGGGGDWGNAYVATWSCAAVQCPEVGDLDADGLVDFNDLLVVLANFGPCP